MKKLTQEKVINFVDFVFHYFRRQSIDLRLRFAMVFDMVKKSSRQGRRDDVEEANSVSHVLGASRVRGPAYTVGEDGLRGKKRRKDISLGLHVGVSNDDRAIRFDPGDGDAFIKIRRSQAIRESTGI